MKIKLDENIPSDLSNSLRALGHDVHTVHAENLTGSSDHEIWEAAQREARFLITQDLDFSDSRLFSPGSHHGILLLRLHSPDRRSLIERVEEVFETQKVIEWVGCFVVVTERKIRLLKTPHQHNS